MTLPNPFGSPHLDGPTIARRRVTRRGTGSSPLGDDVPVLLRIADLTPRTPAAADPVKPEPPSAVSSDPTDVEEPVTIKFVPASSSVAADATDRVDPTDPTDPTDPNDLSDRTDRSHLSPTTTAPAREQKPLRKPPGERRRRENIPPPVETRKSVATQWGVILVLVVAIVAVYFAFTNRTGNEQDEAKSNRVKKPSSNFVPAENESAPTDAKVAPASNAPEPNENHAEVAGPPITPKPSGDPPVVDTTIAPERDGPRPETKARPPAPPPANRRTAPPVGDADAPSLDGPVEREARQPAMPPAYPETDPATYDYTRDNRRVAAPPPENVYEVGSARLNGVQPLPPRDRR